MAGIVLVILSGSCGLEEPLGQIHLRSRDGSGSPGRGVGNQVLEDGADRLLRIQNTGFHHVIDGERGGIREGIALLRSEGHLQFVNLVLHKGIFKIHPLFTVAPDRAERIVIPSKDSPPDFFGVEHAIIDESDCRGNDGIRNGSRKRYRVGKSRNAIGDLQRPLGTIDLHAEIRIKVIVLARGNGNSDFIGLAGFQNGVLSQRSLVLIPDTGDHQHTIVVLKILCRRTGHGLLRKSQVRC